MATHPPLNDRIKKIEPRWNGRLPQYDRTKSSSTYTHPKTKRNNKIREHVFNETLEKNQAKHQEKEERKERFLQGAIAAAMMKVGEIKEEDVEQVAQEIESLDEKIVERLNDPLGAQAVILSLLYEERYKKELYAMVQEESPYLLLEFANFMREPHEDLKHQSALIISLSMNALKSLSIEQYQRFKKIVEYFVTVDNEVTLFEWSLQYIIQRPLEMHLGLKKVPKRTSTHLGAIKEEVEVIYSMLMQAQYSDEQEAKAAFESTKKVIKAGALQYVPKDAISHDRFVGSVMAIERAKPAIAERIFEGVLYGIKVDGEVSESENTFVHAIAQLMQVPLPREFKLEAS